MNVTCTDCASIFRVDPARVPAGGVRARCSVCGAVFPVVAAAAVAAAPVWVAAAVPGDAGGEARRTALPEASPPTGGVDETVAVAGAETTAPGGESTGADRPPAAPTRPFNPYLSNEPGQKARRLARALVSDLVAYQPQKREEGLRAGTLKQLFREEIRKSWEEYVEQVGPSLAESTTHFQDALNDVLAGGRKIF